MAEKEKKAKAPAKPRKTAAKSTTTKAKAPEDGAVTNGMAKVQAMGDGAAKIQAAPETKSKAVSHEEIARLAHRYWAERGYQHGHHEHDWHRAERELRGKAS